MQGVEQWYGRRQGWYLQITEGEVTASGTGATAGLQGRFLEVNTTAAQKLVEKT